MRVALKKILRADPKTHKVAVVIPPWIDSKAEPESSPVRYVLKVLVLAFTCILLLVMGLEALERMLAEWVEEKLGMIQAPEPCGHLRERIPSDFEARARRGRGLGAHLEGDLWR